MNTIAVYQTLRQELLDSYNREVNLATFAFTATAAFIGYGFTAQNPSPLVFLLPLLILALLFVQLNNSILTIFSISVYIRVFIEAESNSPKWKTTISALRDALRKQGRFNPLKWLTEVHFSIAAILMGAICIYLYSQSSSQYFVSIIFAGLWAIYCIPNFLSIWHVNSGAHEQELGEYFKQLAVLRYDLSLFAYCLSLKN